MLLQVLVQAVSLQVVHLVGGETAEMPGMYEGEDYDLQASVWAWLSKAKLLMALK